MAEKGNNNRIAMDIFGVDAFRREVNYKKQKDNGLLKNGLESEFKTLAKGQGQAMGGFSELISETSNILGVCGFEPDIEGVCKLEADEAHTWKLKFEGGDASGWQTSRPQLFGFMQV